MRGQPLRLSNFAGGVNLLDAPYSLADNEARDARNVVSTAKGAVRKRDGVQTYAAPANILTSLVPLDATSSKFLIGAGSTFLYSVDTAAVVTQIKSGLTSGLRWEWVQAPTSGGQGPAFGMNGTDSPQYWDGVAGSTSAWTAASGTLQNGKYLLRANNRIWVAGVAGSPSSLFWSDIGDPRAWPAANEAKFDPNDGEAITGIGTVGPYILVFKRSKAWIVYDLDTGANRPLGRNIGCAAHRSIVETPQGAFFLTADQGVYRTDGSKLERASDKIGPLLGSIVEAQRQNAAGAFVNDHYYLSICTAGSVNDLTVDFDLLTGAWWIHDVAEQQFAVWTAGGSQPKLYGAKGASAKVDRLFVAGATQDNGANFTAYWKSAHLTFGTPFLRKRCRQVYFDGSGSFDLLVAKDFAVGEQLAKSVDFAAGSDTFGGSGTFGGTGTFGGDASVQAAQVFTLGVARAWSLVFRNTGSAGFEVDSATMAMTVRKS